jgi:hypothetical protein
MQKSAQNFLVIAGLFMTACTAFGADDAVSRE